MSITSDHQLLTDEDIEFLVNLLKGSPVPLSTQELIEALRTRR